MRRHDVADSLLVLRDQHGAAARASPRPQTRRGTASASPATGGKEDPEGGALRRGAVRMRMWPLMALDDPHDGRESQAAPGELGGEERVEDPLQRAAVHAAPGVGHLEEHVAAGVLGPASPSSSRPVRSEIVPGASPSASEALVMRFITI